MIKCAEKSPRICDKGIIHWYEGDTFELDFELTFTDDTGEIIPIKETDEISICFRDRYKNIIYETKVIGTNTLPICINKEITKLFKAGKYSYCVRRNSEFITTIMKENIVLVE